MQQFDKQFPQRCFTTQYNNLMLPQDARRVFSCVLYCLEIKINSGQDSLKTYFCLVLSHPVLMHFGYTVYNIQGSFRKLKGFYIIPHVPSKINQLNLKYYNTKQHSSIFCERKYFVRLPLMSSATFHAPINRNQPFFVTLYLFLCLIPLFCCTYDLYPFYSLLLRHLLSIQ